MIKLFKQIPIFTRSIILVSFILYLINLIFYFMEISINDYLGLRQFSDEGFRLYQILTFSFSHDVYPDHIVYNVCYLLIFSVQSEIILGKNFLKLILFTIFFSIGGLQFFDQNGGHLGLSIIGVSTMTYFILDKNTLPDLISFPLKMLALLFIFNEFILFLKGYKNNIIDGVFCSAYSHILGFLSASIFYTFNKLKKGIYSPSF